MLTSDRSTPDNRPYSEVQLSIKSHRLLTDDEIEMVECAGGKEYLQLWGPKFEHVQAVLQSKPWFAFDLDDTLHNFRSASGTALEAVLEKINTDHHADTDAMRHVYRAILTEKTSSAFTDGRGSRDYRKERFEALMGRVRLTCEDEYLDTLADVYQHALSQSLHLKPGAMDLLKFLKHLGKKIAIVTEGPEDGQVWTIRQLGIHDQIDFVATSNRFGISKLDGLLEKVVVDALGISASDLVYIGDNWQRDIEPALQANIYAIYYVEDDNVSLAQTPVRVNTHHNIRCMVEDAPAAGG